MTTTSSTTGSTSNSLLSSYLAKQSAAVASTSSSSSASSANTAAQEVASNFTTFISILTTSLKNQDPTSASDTNQFTNQLMMMCQVEQQLATNTKLDTLVSDTDSSTSAALVDYIGQYVESSSTTSKVVVQDGSAEFSYSLGDTAKSVAITITNSSGSTVATMSGPTSSGSHLVEWDGLNNSGTAVSDGTYNIAVKETATDGTLSSVSSIYMVGQVTGIELDGTKSKLKIGDDVTLKLSDVSTVYQVTKTASSTTSSSTATSSSSSS